MKFFLTLLTIVVVGTVIWFAFALWVGLYSVYSYPPSKEHPDGVTLIVNREEGEPTFNSPAYVPEQPKPTEPHSGIGFESSKRNRRPPELRTVMELPYIEWAYKKSLPPEAKK